MGVLKISTLPICCICSLFSKPPLHHLTSIESWEELKDKLWWNEKIPEEDKEELSGCVAKCWLKDQANDLLGKAYEELKEDAEGKYEESCLKGDGLCDEETLKIATIPCQRCTRYIPAITELQNDDFGDMTVDGIVDKVNTFNKMSGFIG